MNFVQLEFLVFLPLVWLLYWGLGRRIAQNLVLLVASAVFYGWVHPWFLILLYASALTDYTLALGIRRWWHRRRTFVVLSVLFNLGLLGVFKYYDFFVTEVITALQALNVTTDLTTLGIFLPVGISFYTFQTMGYTIDVSRGEIEAREDFVDYALYVTFFPQLVAGPIERASSLLPQVERARTFSWEDQRRGVELALFGAFKKICIADTLAPYVEKVFQLESPSGPLIWAASMAFALQILADFSGYTDLARGTARMFGFRIVRNFDHPFLAASTPEFWRRWHMSLSFWIRDYLWVPLLGSGSSTSTARMFVATLVAFSLMGLWHGPAWNYLLFGVWNAVLMVAYPAVADRLPAAVRAHPVGRAAAVAFHWCIPVTVSMMIFREQDLGRIVAYLSQSPFAGTADEWTVTAILAGVTVVLASPLWLGLVVERTVLPRLRASEWYLPLQTTTWSLYVVAILVLYRSTAEDFIYFQF